jgi:cytochrome b561
MTDHYAPAQIALHWATLGLILISFVTHEDIEDSLELWQEGAASLPDPTALAHFGAGSLVLALTVLRLILRAVQGTPAPLPGQGRLVGLASGAVHGALYLLMLAIPASGLAMVLGLGGDLDDLHEGLFNLLFALVALHAAAALVHHFVWRDGTLARMGLGRRERARQAP